MRILQIIPGTGNFYCGTCLRDHALARGLRRIGHDVMIAPLYLPLVLEVSDDTDNQPMFFGGLNVYFQQKFAICRHTPRWMDRWLDAPLLLRWLGGKASATRASDLGGLTVSMLRDPAGFHRKELDRLTAWLSDQLRPDVVCLATGLLVGLARPIKQVVGAPVVCTLQGESAFLDSLPQPYRDNAWQALAMRATEVDRFVAVSRYYADVMIKRLGLNHALVDVVHNGIELDDLQPVTVPPVQPVLGYLARLCRDKGLQILVDAYVLLRQRNRIKELRLHIAGTMTRSDVPFVQFLRRRLKSAGIIDGVEFSPNIDRAAKADFLRTLSVFSVPATYDEPFGLYVLEALACGVPVVQPRRGAFPELLASTGGGVLCEPDDVASLADAIESVLTEPAHARAEAECARQKVRKRFSADRMARDVAEILVALSRPTVTSEIVTQKGPT